MSKLNNPKTRQILKIISKTLITFLGLGLVFVGYLFLPLAQVSSSQNIEQTSSYSTAMTRFEKLQAQDDAQIRSECKSTLLNHGQKTDKVIVLFHGFTSCPKQFDQFSYLLFEQGYNVLIPRLHYHGMEDLATRDQNKIQASEILNLTAQSVAIASGLGDKVEVLGLSGGAVMALWAGLNLPNVSKVMAVSPILKPYLAKNFPQNPTVKLLEIIPDRYIFWDEELKEKAEFAPYAYKGFSSKALSQFLNIGQTVLQQIDTNISSQTEFILVTSDIDKAVDNNLSKIVFEKLQSGGKITQTHVFNSQDNIPHYSIDPRNKAGNIKLTYPKIIAWLE